MKVDLQAMPYHVEKKGDVRRLRKQGKIPAALYGHGEKTQHIYVDKKDFRHVLNVLKEETVTVNLKVGSKTYFCVIKAIQHNPVNDELFHIDFQHIHKEEKIRTTVPIHPVGAAPGVEKGGILDTHLHEVVVKCYPDKMPSHIDIDVSQLDLGQTIHLRDLKIPDVEFELSPETSVVSVLIPRKAEEVKPELEEAVAVEAEAGQEGEEGKEGVEGREGQTGKEGKEGKKGKEGERGREGAEGREGKK
jgi:large subunit ribosomal protein L25